MSLLDWSDFYDRKAVRLTKLIVGGLLKEDETLWRLGDTNIRLRYRILALPWRNKGAVFRCSLQVLHPNPHACDVKIEVCPHWVTLRKLGIAHVDTLVRIENELDIPFRDGQNSDYEGHSCAYAADKESFQFNARGTRGSPFPPVIW